MNAKSIPPPADLPQDLTPEDLALEDLAPEDPEMQRLLAAVESAIGGLQERLASLADHDHDAKWSVSDLVKLLQLRNQLQGERPRTVFAYWVDDPSGIEKQRRQQQPK
jgi:hypothetical protein